MKKNYQVTASKLNIRSGPGVDYEDIGDVRAGQKVIPVDTTGWLPVRHGSRIGWLAKGYLEEVTESPPVATADFSTKEGTIAAIRAECQRQGLTLPEQIAYVLATVNWETALTFKPVREAFWKDEDWRQRNLSRYYPYYGRGFVQLTWKANYQKYGDLLGIDLVNNPDLALEPQTAAFILVHGFRIGAFTGKKIADYINDHEVDFYNARRCINGTDKAREIAALAEQFLEA